MGPQTTRNFGAGRNPRCYETCVLGAADGSRVEELTVSKLVGGGDYWIPGFAEMTKSPKEGRRDFSHRPLRR